MDDFFAQEEEGVRLDPVSLGFVSPGGFIAEDLSLASTKDKKVQRSAVPPIHKEERQLHLADFTQPEHYIRTETHRDMCVYIFIYYLFVYYLFIYLFIYYLFISLSICLFIIYYLFIYYLFIIYLYLFVYYLFIYLFIYLFVLICVNPKP